MKVCAVIPAFNEEENIGTVVRKTGEYVDRVVVVDDGSVDGTACISEMLGATVIRHGVNRGYGAAVRSCFDAARRFDADVTVFLDGDGQHPPDHIPDLIRSIQDKGVDIVVGSRFLETPSDIPAYRRLGISVLNRITYLFSRENLDSQSGFRAYSKRAIHLLNPVERGMGVSSEILIKAREHNLSVEEVPVSVRYDVGRSSQNPVDHGAGVIVSVIKLVSQKRPLFFFGFSGLVFSGAGLFTGWWVLDNFNQTHALPVGMALVTSMFIISGIFLMGIGMTIYAIQDTVHRCITEREHHGKLIDFALSNSEKENVVDGDQIVGEGVIVPLGVE